MSKFLLPVGFAICLSAVVALPAPTVAAPPKVEEELVEKVRKSIDAGVLYLKKQQNPQGNWEGIVIEFLAGMEGGSTALITLALLNCGIKKDDPLVARAIEYLRKLPPKKTYVVGLCNLVFAEIRDPKDLPLVQKNADWLIQTGVGWQVDANGRVTGKLHGWSYPQTNMSDNSNTQYALLGLYAAKQSGAKIHDDVWQAIQEYYTRTQVMTNQPPNTGGWPYFNPIDGRTTDQPSISMSVAGVCGLLIARMGLDVNEHGLNPQTGVAANCGVYGENSALAKGINWVAGHFKFESTKSTYYNIYGIERMGRLSGQRFIGTHDWYREGCLKLIDIQTRAGDGSFSGGRQVDAMPHLSTAFSLLFLSKGRTPVLVSKFAWGTFQLDANTMTETSVQGFPAPPGGANWNRKHNDTRHIVEFCSKELYGNTPLSWQVYDARRRSFDNEGEGGKSGKEKILEEVGVLLQSPVLYLNGHGPLRLTPAQEEILKTYIEEGGFVVAEACCGDPVFAESFRTTMDRIFKDKKVFKPMSPDHAILKMFPGVLPTDFPELEVMNRGCRTVAVFSPVPLAGYWEEAKYMPKDSKHPANRGEKAFCLIRNIVAYATGMELPKPKLSKTDIVRTEEIGVTRSHFKAAQLQIGGEERLAPDALKNLMGYLREKARLEVALNSVVLQPHDDNLFNFKFMYLHGRKLKDDSGAQILQEQAIESLQSNLNSGGLLFADAACNGYDQWKKFDQSFRELCAKLYPDKKLEVITEKLSDGTDDPLYKVAREAEINLRNTRCRRELPGGGGAEPELRQYAAHLEGIRVGKRWVVIYSKYDIGCAIEGHKSADCLGYDKESALRIAAAVVLYSLKR